MLNYKQGKFTFFISFKNEINELYKAVLSGFFCFYTWK
uniref:Uncharacterized protein n=1 Tax=uncultured Flavobacteriia bacterium TaxID=212695 RepID=H6RID3_9BACT|nr:hypothetical protein VIS_S3CEB40032 [uncultured Flavobacteriia bacterium]